MRQSDVVAGVRVSTLLGSSEGTVTRVTRSRFRHRLLRFWIAWDGTAGESEMMPGDGQHLVVLMGGTT